MFFGYKNEEYCGHSLTLSLTPTFLLDGIYVGTTHWKWIPHSGETRMGLPNRRVSVRESARKRMFLSFLYKNICIRL